MNIDTEGMQRAARQSNDAAESMRRSSEAIEEAIRKLSNHFEQGYGSPVFALIELLEKAQSVETKPTSYLLGQRVIYFDEIVEIHTDRGHLPLKPNDSRNVWVWRPVVGYHSYVSRDNIKPLPGGQL